MILFIALNPKLFQGLFSSFFSKQSPALQICNVLVFPPRQRLRPTSDYMVSVYLPCPRLTHGWLSAFGYSATRRWESPHVCLDNIGHFEPKCLMFKTTHQVLYGLQRCRNHKIVDKKMKGQKLITPIPPHQAEWHVDV